MNAKDDDGSVTDFGKRERMNYETNPAILLKKKHILFLPGPSAGTLRLERTSSHEFSQGQSPP
jgi:hypothetical protein